MIWRFWHRHSFEILGFAAIAMDSSIAIVKQILIQKARQAQMPNKIKMQLSSIFSELDLFLTLILR